MPMITGPGAFDPLLGKMRTKDVSGGTASGDYTFNTAEFTVGVAGLVSLNQVPASKLDTVSDIVNVSGASVTLQPNTAYKIYATSQAITLNANPPAAGKWAYEGHIELFVAGTGYVVTGTNVVLANALEPDSVNNCTVRFHDGIAIISVEDHLAGYIVVNGSTAGDGSLAYGIATSTNEYIAFDASLNGTVIPLAGAVAEGEKHIVGNGYNETTLTGAVDCSTAKVTVANLSLSDVGITGGTMTLGDAYIPDGATVAVSGGGLAVEKVTGAGSDSVIDLGGTHIGTALSIISGVSFINGKSTQYGGAVQIYGGSSASFADTNITGCSASSSGGGIYVGAGSSAFVSGGTISNCSAYLGGGICVASNGYLSANGVTFTGNNATYGGPLAVYTSAVADLTDCIVSGNSRSLLVHNGAKLNLSNSVVSGTSGANHDINLTSSVVNILGGCTIGTIRYDGSVTFAGNNTIDYVPVSGTVTISSGASINLTSSINPGGTGGITVLTGGCTVNGNAIPAGTYTSIDSNGQPT